MSETDPSSLAARLRDSVETCHGCKSAELVRRDLAKSVSEGDLPSDRSFELYASFVGICTTELAETNVTLLPTACGFMNNLNRSGPLFLELTIEDVLEDPTN